MRNHTFESDSAQLFISRMLKALKAKHMTRAQMQAELFASKTKVLNYIRYLHGDTGENKRIYISGYEDRENGGRNPIYAEGNRPDAVPPGKRTSAEYYKRRIATDEKHSRHLAKLRVKALEKRSRTKPVSIWSALGL